MKKSLVVYYLLFSCGLNAQNSIENHKKYWYYRSRLVNDYVKIGATPGIAGQGESLPFNQRARYANDIYFKSPDMAMGDELSTLGLYIGVLATEYKLLSRNFQNTDKVKHELFCALNAVNRLDYYAESALSPPCNSSLNGFFMRDDMPKDFVRKNYKHFNYQNSWNSVSNPPNSYQLDRGFASLGQQGVYQTWSNYQDYIDQGSTDRTDIWMSQDHAISLLFGLSLVNALVDDQATDYNQDQFYDPGHVSLRKAAQGISDRIVEYIQHGGAQLWHIYDPCIPGLYIGGSRGGNANTYAYAFAETRGIASGQGKCLDPSCVEPSCPIVPVAFPPYHDTYTMASGYLLWQTISENAGVKPDIAVQMAELSASCNCIYRKDGGVMESYLHNVLTQAWGWLGIGFGWVTEVVQQTVTYYVPVTITNVTNDAMITNTIAWNLDYAPFAARLIHNTQSIVTPPEINNLEPLLNQAPCEGPWNLSTNQLNNINAHYSNYEWSSDTRVEHPERRGTAFGGYDPFNGQPKYYDIIRGEYNGLDYMLYHNLWYLYRNTFDGGQYSIVDLSDRILDNNFTIPASYDVSDGLSEPGAGSHVNPATLGAFETIRASNPILSTADVTYRAGKNIQFANGFHVQSGASFHAYIDPYSCSGLGSNGAYNRTAQNNSSSGSGYLNGDMLPISTHHVKYDPSVLQYPLPLSTEVNTANLSKPTPDLKKAISNAIQKSAIEEISFNVSPNPSSGTFKVSLPVSERVGSCTVWVYDMQGKEVYSDVLKGANTMEIKLADALPGTYLVRAMTEKGAQYKSKIVIK